MERKYTFVIGAGASREFDFPIGNELVSKISELLRIKVDDLERPSSGNRELLASLSRLSHPDPSKRLNQAYVYSTANWVSENMGLAASIDNFLDAHRVPCATHRVRVFRRKADAASKECWTRSR